MQFSVVPLSYGFRLMAKSKTHGAIWLSVLASVLLHIAGLYMARDFWLDELETESFRSR